LSHYDDEIFLFKSLYRLNEDFIVVYTTNAQHPPKVSQSVRQAECLKAWSLINNRARVVFFGDSEALKDAELFSSFTLEQFKSLDRLIKKNEISEMWCVSPDGGHHDHDFTFAIARRLSRINQIRICHLPGYSKIPNSFWKKFQVMNFDYDCNCDEVVEGDFSPKFLFLSHVRLFLIYKSQWRTWVGLGPSILLSSFKNRVRVHTCSIDIPLAQDRCLWVTRKRADYNFFSLRLRLFENL
jgi:hypothetical protein